MGATNNASALFNAEPGSTASTAAGVATFGANLFSGLSALEAGKARESQARFRSKIAELKSEDAIERGKIAEKRLRQQISQLVGKQRTTYAAGNVQLDQAGTSAAEVEEQTLLFGDEDAMTIRANAMREALGYQAQAVGFQMEAEQQSLAGRGALSGSLLSGTTSALSIYRMFGDK